MLSAKHAEHIVYEMKSAIHQDINIMDSCGIIIASTNPTRCGTLHQGALRIIESRLPSLIIREDDPSTGVQKGINLPITIGGETVGVIGITGEPEEVSVFGDIIKRMTEVMTQGLRQQEQSDLIDRAKSLFIENWLFSPEPDLSELEVRGRLLGLDITEPYTVAILQTTPSSNSQANRPEDLSEMRNSLFLRLIQPHLDKSGQDFCAIIHNRIMVLLHRSSRDRSYSLIQQICSDIQNFHHVTVSSGISSSSQHPMDIRRCYLEAKTASAVSVQSPRHPIIFYDQASLEFIVQSIPDPIRRDLKRLIFAQCLPEEVSELTQTVRLYFEHNGDLRACAETAYIHRNTFQYRMDRVKKKTGYDLKKPKESLLLYLVTQD